VNQRKQAQLLVTTFKNAIDAVVQERKEKTGVRSVTKDTLQAGDKKRILELFVENDNTLSHLLEFISSKLVDNP
jgi:pantothenate synthetase